MSKYSREDIIRMVEDEDVEFIRLQFTDLMGNLKNVAITTSQLNKVLDNKCMFDGSSVEGFVPVWESDMYLYPDLDTFTIFPWRPQQGKVARLLCDVYRPDGSPFEGDPRYILKNVIKEAEELGYRFDVGPECEFFLFDLEEDLKPTAKTNDMGGYFDVGPMDSGENARREMVMTLEDMGYEVEASHHEGAPSQHEIDVKYEDALKAADNIMTFKLVVRTIARRHGLHATFMPKPRYGVNGSGMHINMSLSKDGINIFNDPSGEHGLSDEAYQFMAGIMKHMKGMCAITNPLVNSYKRLLPGFEAPMYIAWSIKNRSHAIRIPTQRGSETRIELRSPDPSANPYLAIAVCLAAGLDGIKNKLNPPKSSDENILVYSEEEKVEKGITRLPSTLIDAINELEQSTFIQSVLGEHVTKNYINVKKKEWDEYKNQVTKWELDQYLHRV